MNHSQAETEARQRITRVKHRYGIWFGISLGLAFAITSWGVDAVILERTHGLLPWLKVSVAAILCALVGGLTGWISARLNRASLALLLWIAAAAFFAWLTAALPFLIAPWLIEVLRPDVGSLLNYTYYEVFSSRISLAYVWIAIFTGLAGLLQIPLSDSAVFSTTPMGRVAPMLVCVVLVGIGGLIVDSLNNEPLRSASTALDDTVQFWIEHQGQEIDPAEARRMHVGALRAVAEQITPERSLIVSSYDELLGQVRVLALFEGSRVECQVYFGQLITCEEVPAP